METPEARALLEDPAAMREATPEQLARVLTVVVRLERFSEGAMTVVGPEPRYEGRISGTSPPRPGSCPGAGDRLDRRP
jgi:hypothetical protein